MVLIFHPEDYRGSANNEVWIYDLENETYKKLTSFDGHDNYPRWADARTLYYASAESGTYNIHKIKICVTYAGKKDPADIISVRSFCKIIVVHPKIETIQQEVLRQVAQDRLVRGT